MKPESLIEYINGQYCNAPWVNGEKACFEYDISRIVYQKIQRTDENNNLLLYKKFRNDENCPIFITGFVAYLIRHWGKSGTVIYNDFYLICRSYFKSIESIKPTAVKRDLEQEFYNLHVKDEKERIRLSEMIFPYLTDEDVRLIKEYVESYFEFIKREFAPKTVSEMNASEWVVVFYYAYSAKALPIATSLNKSIESFIQVNAIETTTKYFRTKYYEIKTRINDKNDYSFKKIEKILPKLKIYPNATQLAENDIDFLKNEVEDK